MARFTAGAALIAAATLAVATAQTLPRLHVTALAIRADRSVVQADVPFHLIVHVHVTEKLARLDELILPTLTNAVDLGDEQQRASGPTGTDFVETMTVSAIQPGEAAFTPAYIDVIDPLSGKALRVSSNALSVSVTPGSPLDVVTRSATATIGALAALVTGAAVLVVLIALLVRAGRRRRIAVLHEGRDAPRALPTSPSPPTDDPLRDAIALVRARGDDESMDTLRVVLYARAGLGIGATLGDALRELGDRDPQLARTLEATERARFGPIAERPAATRELLRLLYAYASGEEAPA